MRRRFIGAQMMILCLLLGACGSGQGGGSGAERLALDIRTEYIAMAACTASMEVTADYGERVYQYGMGLTWEKDGETVLTLTSPEEVSGVTVRIEAGETALKFDGARIETGPLTQDGLSPVDAVPALLRWAREGFIDQCTEEALDEVQTLRMTCRDPDAEPGTGIEATLWFDLTSHALVRGEIASDGFTVIQCAFRDFQRV